ncbi:MAG: hypothetical protein ABEI06_09355 [Halobacteriaceae archaeon]
MDISSDELAAIVDLFDGMTHQELHKACKELAARKGRDYNHDQVSQVIQAAIESYHLVAIDSEEGSFLLSGPVAFPQLPEHGDDLPHILDIPDRDLTKSVVVDAVEQQFRKDAAQAVNRADVDRIQTLIDISYDLEAWGPMTLQKVRNKLDQIQQSAE